MTGHPPLPFIRLSRDAASPLSAQLYEQIRRAILKGVIKPGARLPSSRALALELSLSRNTVVTAFDQLAAEGYIEPAVGRGSTVRPLHPERIAAPRGRAARRRPALRLSERGARLSANDSTSILRSTPPKPFRMGVPALDEFPSRLWAGLLARRWRTGRKEHLMYSNTAGYPPLRSAIAEYLGAARGVRCDPEQIVIVSGAQQALFLAAKLFASRGDGVWTEDPGYLAAKAAFRAAELRIVAVPLDSEGANIAGVRGEEPAPKLLYVTPSHQYPLGVTMTISRRLEILRWARANRVAIVEDDYNSEYRYEGRPVPALQGLDEAGRVLYVGTFSKVLFPSLRIGYMVAPAELVPAIVFARSTLGEHSFSAEQAALAELISEGHLARHVRRTRELYSERKHVLEETLRRELPGGCEVLKSAAGMHSVVLLPASTDDKRVAAAARDVGLEVTALSRYYVGEPRNGLLLGFSGFPSAALVGAAKKLARILSHPAR